jgi:hypothetical protein
MRRQIEAVLCRGLDGVGQVPDGVYFENECPGSGFQGAAGCINRVVPGKNDHFRILKVTANLFGQIQAIEAGQTEIDNGNVGMGRLDQLKRFPTVACLRANFAHQLSLQCGGNAQTDDFVIVRQQNPEESVCPLVQGLDNKSGADGLPIKFAAGQSTPFPPSRLHPVLDGSKSAKSTF